MQLKYYLIYKPFRVLSQFSPVEGKKCLADYFRFEKDVYSIGRLDYDSEGLMLLTNDKKLKTIIQNPAMNHTKEYLVQVDGDITNEATEHLQKGVEIKIESGKYMTRPCNVEKLELEPKLPDRNPPIRFRQNIPAPWIKVILTEGKNRQIRKMTAKVGFPALRIVRIAIGKIGLDRMQPGEWKAIEQYDIYGKLGAEKNLY
jgi:23S rRNA pseudouridine2457 synthase